MLTHHSCSFIAEKNDSSWRSIELTDLTTAGEVCISCMYQSVQTMVPKLYLKSITQEFVKMQIPESQHWRLGFGRSEVKPTNVHFNKHISQLTHRWSICDIVTYKRQKLTNKQTTEKNPKTLPEITMISLVLLFVWIESLYY